MPRKGRSNEEIIHALHQVEGSEKVTEVCRRLGVSEQTFYRWKKQFSGLGLQELRKLRSLRHETAKLRQVTGALGRLRPAPIAWRTRSRARGRAARQETGDVRARNEEHEQRQVDPGECTPNGEALALQPGGGGRH